MIQQMTFDEAADIIDIYGADELFWPEEHVADLNRMIANDEDFRTYVDDAKWLEDMLENWTTSDDGANIDLGDDMFDAGNAEPQNEDRYDPADSMDDHEDETLHGGGVGGHDDEDGGSGAGSDQELGSDEEEEKPVIIDLDPGDVRDMDEMLQDFIKKQLENADPTEFRVFTRDYDGMVDIKVPDHVSLDGISQRVAKSVGPLQKDLRRLIAARSQVKRIPGMRRGRLHAPNLHRVMAGDDRVFTRRETAESLDTAISLLIDCSGSMSGEPTVLATETAYALGEVLSKLGIAFECLGFTDNWKDPRVNDKTYIKELNAADKVAKITRAIPIIMPKFKTFDERWTIPVQKRFGHVHNMGGHSEQCGYEMGSTPEGCGLEFAGRRLLARKEKRKILISMTDGEPGGHVHNPRGYSDYFAYKQQSINVVRAIEASGIDLVGIGIQHDGPTGYYSNSIVIQEIEDMPKQLLGLLKRFIAG